MSDGRSDSVALFQGCGDVERITNDGNDHGFGAIGSHCLDPERQQTTYPGVLQNEKRAVAILTLESFLSASAKSAGNGRGIPLRIEGVPVPPGAPRRCEDLIVQKDDLSGLPVPGFIAGIRFQQRRRQIAAEDVQHAGQQRGPAPVHSGDQDRDLLLPLTGQFQTPRFCIPGIYSLFSRDAASMPMLPIRVCRYTPAFS